METVVILCDGEFPKKAYPLWLLETADAVFCCDGALRKYLNHTRKRFGTERAPEAVIGDMDTLSPALRKRYADRIVRIAEQDDNDMTKALAYVLAHYPQVRTIHFLGATGLREDHTVGNMSLLMEYPRLFGCAGLSEQSQGPTVDIVSDYGTMFAVTDTCELAVGEGRRVSLFCPDNSLNLQSEGLVWSTDAVVFDNWWKATLNRASADTIKLTFSHPSRVLVCLD